MTAEPKIRSLHADEIECRVGSIYDSGITLLLYKNARVDQAILDEVFGVYGWQRSHTLIGNSLYCTVSIWDREKEAWISKQDVGTTGDFEKEKSAASDSFKRACVNLEIGRELYTAPRIFVPGNKVQEVEKSGKKMVKDYFSVSAIMVSPEKVITNLCIINQRKEEVFRWSCQKSPACEDPEYRELYREMERTGVSEEMILQRYGASSLKELDAATRKRALSGLKRSRTAA